MEQPKACNINVVFYIETQLHNGISIQRIN